ncbi:hypothetical protein QBC43DRAFT_310360 [Cladorrhinum sp. PSN259]|nr:hypothetical protein QBC43DRAFT_310360 [Cladorrhinum sp. PSN259]
MEPPSRRFTAPLAVIFATLAVGGLWVMRVEPPLHAVPVNFDVLVFEKRQQPDGAPLRTRYTGLAWVDSLMTMLVGAFMPGVAGRNANPQVWLQQWYFLTQFFAVVCAWTIEAHRVGNQGRIIRFTGIFALFYQTIGGAVILPVYYLFWLFSASRKQNRSESVASGGRHLSASHAGALLPAVVLGYLVPTVALYFPWDTVGISFDSSRNGLQILAAIWQVAPLVPNLLVWLFASLGARSSSRKNAAGGDRELAKMLSVHLLAGVFCAAAHGYFVYSCLRSADPRLSLTSVLMPDRNTWKRDMAHGLLYLFQWDFWICFAATLLWCWVAVADARPVGAAGDATSASGLLVVGLGIWVLSVILGPGAAVSATWYWIDSQEQRRDLTARGSGERKSKAT